MVLATHIIIGGTLGAVSRANPFLAFVVGFLSHFILDSIPHWDYSLSSGSKEGQSNPLDADMVLGKAFIFDLIRIGMDILVGVGLLTFLFWDGYVGHELFLNSIVWGAIGGAIPDFLQFAYMKLRKEPLTSLQRFHIFIHAETRLIGRFVIGPLLQGGLVLFVLLFFNKFLSLL